MLEIIRGFSCNSLKKLEAATGFEPVSNGFADRYASEDTEPKKQSMAK